jgi:hypothetical protein
MKKTDERCVFCNTPVPTVMEQNNPAPAADHGYCCHICNMLIVVPARLGVLPNILSLGKENDHE